jgi:hypothetical protein
MSNCRSSEMSILGAGGVAPGAGEAADGAPGAGTAPPGRMVGDGPGTVGEWAGATGDRGPERGAGDGIRERIPESFGGYRSRTGDGSRPVNRGAAFVALGARRGDVLGFAAFPFRFAAIRLLDRPGGPVPR